MEREGGGLRWVAENGNVLVKSFLLSAMVIQWVVFVRKYVTFWNNINDYNVYLK